MLRLHTWSTALRQRRLLQFAHQAVASTGTFRSAGNSANAAGTSAAEYTEALLSRFGQHTTLQVRDQRRRDHHRRRQPAGNGSEGAEGAGVTYKASVTTRVGGFGVTIAAASDTTSSQRACQMAAAMAMASDIDQVCPDNEPVFDQLRYLALGLGRMLRFSVAPHSDGAEAEENARWVCHAYEKDDWHLENKHVLNMTAAGETPKRAFITALYGVCSKYKAEADASPKGLEDIAELRLYLGLRGKTVADPQVTTQTEGTKKKFSASVTVTDENENTYTMTSGPVPTAYAACRSCALQVYKHEENSPTRTILASLRWQLDGMCDAGIRDVETKRLVDLVTNGGFKYAPSLDPHDQVIPCEPELAIETQDLGSGQGHYATVYYGNRELAQRQADGSYLAELNATSSAIESLFKDFPKVGETLALPMTSVADLTREYHQCTAFSAVDILKGSKLSPYGVLGACTSRHFNQYYAVTYTTLDTNAHRCTVHVDDPSKLGQKRVVGQAVSKTRGQAWKAACMSALRTNFPLQLEEVKDRNEFQHSGDTPPPSTKEAAQEALIKAMTKLPRSTRIERCSNLLQLVETFGATEHGWRQVSVHAEQDQLMNWNATLRRRNEKDGSWVEIARSRPSRSKRDATKLVTFAAASEFFPAELEQYLTLGKNDITRAEIDNLSRTAPFAMDNSVLSNILIAIGGRGAREAATVTVETDPNDLRKLEVSIWKGDVRVHSETSDPTSGEIHSDELGLLIPTKGDDAAVVPLVVRACAAAARNVGVEARVKQVWQQHRAFVPPTIQRLQDLCDFLIETVLGSAPKTETSLVGNMWFARVSAEVGSQTVVLASASGTSKKESIRLVIASALQRNFAQLLAHYKRSSVVELLAVADEVLRGPRFAVTTGMLLHTGTLGSDCASRDDKARPSTVLEKRKLSSSVPAPPPPPPPKPQPPPTQPVNVASTPYKFLKACVRRDNPGVAVVPEWNYDLVNQAHKCTLRLIANEGVQGKPPQLIGTSHGQSKATATHSAALAALKALFPDELERAVKQHPHWMA